MIGLFIGCGAAAVAIVYLFGFAFAWKDKMSFIRDFYDAFVGRTAGRGVGAVILGTIGYAAVLLLVLVILLWAVAQSIARDDGQWGNTDPKISEWYKSLMQPDQPYMSCCGEADAFEADMFEIEGDHYIAVITDGKGIMPAGTRIQVPNAKMKWDKGNPTGHGIIFMGSGGQIYCYVAPGGV